MNVVLNTEVCLDTSWPEYGKINYIYVYILEKVKPRGHH